MEDKIAVVTGGTGGIGKAIVKRFVKEGMKVIVLAKNLDQLLQLKNEFKNNVEIFKLDLFEIDKINEVFENIIKVFPKIDILVNGAGICYYTDFNNLTIKQIEETLRINLIGHFILTRLVVENMVSHKTQGSIVNMGSINSFLGSSLQIDYSLSKAALESFTKSLAREVGKYGIRVNIVCPGIIPTNLNKEILNNKELAKERIKNIPLGRFGNTEEIASVVYFLANEESSYITGTRIIVDGGWSSGIQ